MELQSEKAKKTNKGFLFKYLNRFCLLFAEIELDQDRLYPALYAKMKSSDSQSFFV